MIASDPGGRQPPRRGKPWPNGCYPASRRRRSTSRRWNRAG